MASSKFSAETEASGKGLLGDFWERISTHLNVLSSTPFVSEFSWRLNRQRIARGLAAYGEAGERLQVLLAEKAMLVSKDEEGEQEEPTQPAGPVQPPKKLRAEMPKYPRAKLFACHESFVALQLVIDREGYPSHPTLFISKPVLAFAAMDKIREWRFKPAMLDGEPVIAYYNITVSFRVSGCKKYRG